MTNLPVTPLHHPIRNIILLILVGLVLSGVLLNRIIPKRILYPALIAQPTPPPPSPTPTLTPTPTSLPTPTNRPTPKPTPSIHSIQAFVTYYGWPDNGPSPGNGIAYPQSRYPNVYHEVAGGTGTYQDPITFASAADLFPVGAKLYVPYLKKYVIKEDLCGSCRVSPPHIDIWMESDGSYPSELDQCQGDYTRESVAIEVDPPPGRPVNPTPLFDKTTGTCSN